MGFIKNNILYIKSKFKMKLIKQKIKILNVLPVESKTIVNSDNLISNNLLIGQDNQKSVYKLSKDKYTVGTLKHYPPAIKEWNNSIYSFQPNNNMKLLPSIDKSVYNILKGYFNLNPTLTNNTKYSVSKRLNKFSMIKLFIGKPEIKHSNNKVTITIYVYNRKKIYFLNKIKKIMKIYAVHTKKFNKLKSYTTDHNKSKLTKIKDYKLILSLILIKNFKFRLNLIKIKNSTSVSLDKPYNVIDVDQNKLNLTKRKTLKSIPRGKLSLNNMNVKNKKLLSHKLRLLKKKLQKINKFLFNVLKNKSTPFLFIYLKKKLPFLFLYLKNKPNKINSTILKPFLNVNDVDTIKLLNISRDRTATFKKLLSYKHYCSMLYFNSYIFNANNLLPLKDILKKIYHKKVEFNIINLKYLYLDSNIFAEAITRKLKDRQKRVLRVLKLGLNLTKKPYFKIHFHKKNNLQFLFCDKKLDLNINSVWGKPNSIKNEYLIYKPNAYKLRIFLYHMKQKIISGIRLQGTGRLTKRLTAARSISKVKYMGSLKNLNSSYENVSTVMLRGFVKSNLQYININNYNRNGSFGVKVSISVY